MRLVIAAAALAIHTAAAQEDQPTAKAMIARSDSVRNPSRPFRVRNTVVDYVGGKARDRLVLTVYSKMDTTTGRFDNLVRYAEPPRDLGKMVLLNTSNMWFYDPSSKTSVRISPQQRLIGLASNGDVVTVSLARDYTGTLVGTDTLQDADRVSRVCWHLDLVAADKEAVYSRIEYWIERGTYRPVKGKYYSDSGRPLKIAYFHKYEDYLGAARPGEAVIIDAVDPNLVTTMTWSDYHVEEIPDAWFQRDFLPRLSEASPAASEDRDLAAIPSAVRDTSPAPLPRRTGHGRRYVEDAVSATRSRDGPSVPDWHNRTSFDITDRWRLPARLTATVSGRLNAIEASDLAALSGHTFGYDFREGYLTWEPRSRVYLEAGRINVRNGVALGFNPTDFFKTRSVVDQASQDPSVVREDRLGTLMVRGQGIWSGGSASIAFAPKLYAPTALAIGRGSSTTPELDRTNAADRVLASVSVDVAGLAPQAFVYHEGARTRVGADVSRLISPSIVAYAEWAGGVEPSLADQAVVYGRATGTLPANVPVPPLGDSARRFRNDLALGGSWSGGPTTKLTINAEYHYHEAGFSRGQWNRWFGVATPTNVMWYIRGFANDQQQPTTRQEVFLRADRPDAIVHDLELTGFAFVNLSDGSTLIQLAASYLISDSWTVAAYVPANIGGVRSERGSVPQAGGVIVQVVRYL